MKRIGNLYSNICSVENLLLADRKARRGKGDQPTIQKHLVNQEVNIQALHEELINKTYTTSKYYIFTIKDPKERTIYRLPYKDRIVHHAIMNYLEPLLVSMFTADTYSCIKGRGVHKAGEALKVALRDRENTKYCLKLDIRKFYPSVDGAILKTLLRRKIKDADLLWLLDNIIDSAEGLPIGNYLSQYLSNFFLTGYDHWLKEVKKVRYYFRYADDMVLLAATKEELHALLADIRQYLAERLNLQLKGNYQLFPVDKEKRGIDFIGYVFYHTHTLVRKRIKQNYIRKIKKHASRETIASLKGWLKHGNCKNLTKKHNREDFQRIRNNDRNKGVHWRQDRRGKGAEQGSGAACIQDREIQALRGQELRASASEVQGRAVGDLP